MTKDEALRLALEALEAVHTHGDVALVVTPNGAIYIQPAINGIKAALEAKYEPVVWNEGVPSMLPKQKEGETFIVSYEPKLEAKDEPDWKALVLNHNADCESRCDMDKCGYKPYFEHNKRRCPDCPVHETIDVEYTPQQRKPLTDDEITLIIADCASSHQHTDIHLARAIESAHGIKGEAK